MKSLSRSVLLLLLAAVMPFTAHAQADWPTKPIRLVIGYPPGGAVDALARGLTPALGRVLGQPVVVENRPGAGQALGAELVAKAEPDGYTIALVDSGPLTISPHLRAMPFDPFKSFTPVGGVAKMPLVLVVPANGVHNLQELVEAARKKPGQLSYASAGMGSMHNLTGEYLKNALNLDIVHVPYKGFAMAAPDVISGRVTLSVTALSSGLVLIRDNKLRAIGVTSPKRSAALPDVPTIAEQGVPGFDAQGWVVMLAPRGVPPAIVAKLGAALRVALKEPSLIQQEVIRGGNELLNGLPEEVTSVMSTDYVRWGKLIRDQGIRAE